MADERRWRAMTMMVIRLPNEDPLEATTAYEKPGERHDTDEERTGTDDAKKNM